MEYIATLEEVEKAHIERALIAFNGNKSHAAEALGISLRNIRYKIERYGWDHFKGHVRPGKDAARAMDRPSSPFSIPNP